VTNASCAFSGFGGTYSFHLQGGCGILPTPKTETSGYSEMLVIGYETTSYFAVTPKIL
jgi:hypothetical protein